MPSHPHTAVDTRGYFFVLPTLGLPDSAGEWVTVQGAIAPLFCASTIRPHLGTAANPAPACTPPAVNCESRHVEFQGAAWILRKIAPRTRELMHVECFSLDVWRMPLTDEHYAIQSAGQDNVICLGGADWQLIPMPAHKNQEPESEPKPAPKKQAKAKNKSSLGRQVAPSPSASSSSSSSNSQRRPTAAELDIERSFTDPEIHSSGIFALIFQAELILAGAYKGEHKIMLGLQTDPSSGEIVGLTYAGRRKGDLTNIPDSEWAPLPSHAMLPGMQRHQVNVCRQVLAGQGPLPPPPSPSAKSLSHGKG